MYQVGPCFTLFYVDFLYELSDLRLGCKIAKPSFRAEICPLPKGKPGMSWQGWAFIGLGVMCSGRKGLKKAS